MPVADHIKDAMTKASWIRKMFEKGNELVKLHGKDKVFDFTLGNPVLEPPDLFFESMAELAGMRSHGRHRYMANPGYPEVRDAVAAKLDSSGVLPGAKGSGVVMSVGAGGGLNVALKTILNPGDEVIILAPYFVEYIFYIQNHGGRHVLVETAENFDIDPEKVAAAIGSKTRAVIVNSPNNPSGRVFSAGALKGLCAALTKAERKNGRPVYLISDEPYRELIFSGEKFVSPASMHMNAMMVYSWSKSLSIPGERIGYVAINPAAKDLKTLADGLTFSTRVLGFVNAPASMQWLVSKLLDVTIDVGLYAKKRDRVVSALQSMGIWLRPPDGTFYVFPRSPLEDDVEFVNRALEEKVLLVPGSGFGRKGFFRIAFCVDDRVIEGGLDALGRLMKRL